MQNSNNKEVFNRTIILLPTATQLILILPINSSKQPFNKRLETPNNLNKLILKDRTQNQINHKLVHIISKITSLTV